MPVFFLPVVSHLYLILNWKYVVKYLTILNCVHSILELQRPKTGVFWEAAFGSLHIKRCFKKSKFNLLGCGPKDVH